MKIIFDTGESEECSPDDQRQISLNPSFDTRFRTRLPKVWDNPPTYAKLDVVRCRNIVRDHWMMTSSGLKRVAKVEK